MRSLVKRRPLIGASIGLLLGVATGFIGLKIDPSMNPTLHPTVASNQGYIATLVRYLVIHPITWLVLGYLAGMGYGFRK